MLDTAFIVNPWAGSGRAERVWSRLADAEPKLANAPLVESPDPQVARGQLRALLRQGLRRLVVVGGDGSLHHVINTLMEEGAQERVSMGVVPVGSGVDLARSLDLIRSPRAALKHALHAPDRPLDLLRVRSGDGRTRYVLNIASFGISGEVAQAVNRLRVRNAFSYLTAAARALGGFAPPRARISLDGEPWYEGPLFLLAVANGGTFGRGMRIAPHALPDDGQAEVVLARHVPARKVLPRLPYLYFGAHLGLSFVDSAPARRVRIEPLGAHAGYEMDGELMQAGEVEVEVLAGAVRVVV